MTLSTTDALFTRTAKEMIRDLIAKAGLAKLHVAIRKFSGQNVDHLSFNSLSDRFSAIYRNRVWIQGRSAGSLSGYGSELENTETLRQRLPELLNSLEAQSLLDIGCGDFTWMKEIAFPHKYIGVDIVPELIETNNVTFRSEQRSFQALDATQDPLPQVDSILCREVLFHLSFTDIWRLIENIRGSGSLFLIATTDCETNYNADILSGDFRLLNLHKAPFFFPKPTLSILDNAVSPGRTLSAWKLTDLPEKREGWNRMAGFAYFPSLAVRRQQRTGSGRNLSAVPVVGDLPTNLTQPKQMRSLNPRMCDKTETPRHSLSDSGGEIALAYVGAVVPDEPQFHTAAFNPSGQMYQQELLLGLKRVGLPASLILSVLPIPAYPNGAKIWIRGGEAYLPEGMRLTFIPFINIFLFKQIAIGVATVLHLLFWRWRTRRAAFRIVYTYNLTVPPGLFTLFGARIIGAKAVVSLCDINVPGETAPSGWPWHLDYWLQRKLIPHFDGHVTAADAIAREFIPGRPYLRLEGGIRAEEPAKHLDRSIAKENLGAAFVVTATGTLNEANGVPILLKAFSLLEGEGYRLCMAGRGPLEELVREAATTDPRIEYLGFISSLEVLHVYQRSDVLVNMRVTGSMNTKYFFPGKMMEYLASGTPVITTCTGHTEEEFADFVFLLRDETPQGLAALIRQVANLDSGERRRVGGKAQQYIALNKTWDVQARKVARFIREVVLGIDVLPSDQACSSQNPVDSTRLRHL